MPFSTEEERSFDNFSKSFELQASIMLKGDLVIDRILYDFYELTWMFGVKVIMALFST